MCMFQLLQKIWIVSVSVRLATQWMQIKIKEFMLLAEVIGNAPT